jgi:hypothetical protein
MRRPAIRPTQPSRLARPAALATAAPEPAVTGAGKG